MPEVVVQDVTQPMSQTIKHPAVQVVVVQVVKEVQIMQRRVRLILAAVAAAAAVEAQLIRASLEAQVLSS
jgi:hypothetical protein